jgi:hypothetical protein
MRAENSGAAIKEATGLGCVDGVTEAGRMVSIPNVTIQNATLRRLIPLSIKIAEM